MAAFEFVLDEGIPVMVISGKLGFENLDRFQAKLEELVARPGRCVIVDLSDCPYMSSRSFPPLLHRSQEMKDAGRRLLVASNEGLAEILRILRLDQRLELFPSRLRCIEVARALGSL